MFWLVIWQISPNWNSDMWVINVVNMQWTMVNVTGQVPGERAHQAMWVMPVCWHSFDVLVDIWLCVCVCVFVCVCVCVCIYFLSPPPFISRSPPSPHFPTSPSRVTTPTRCGCWCSEACHRQRLTRTCGCSNIPPWPGLSSTHSLLVGPGLSVCVLVLFSVNVKCFALVLCLAVFGVLFVYVSVFCYSVCLCLSACISIRLLQSKGLFSLAFSLNGLILLRFSFFTLCFTFTFILFASLICLRTCFIYPHAPVFVHALVFFFHSTPPLFFRFIVYLHLSWLHV